ncbi:hypothetical protein GQ457_05G017530 [Hibiscus cannabinus]
MASLSTSNSTMLMPLVVGCVMMAASASNFYQDFDITWGDGRGKILNNGQLLSLSLDKASGSGFQSKNEYLFGKIDMQLKYFHTYSILWNPQRIIFSVDGTPIREFKNMELIGVSFPKNQAMRIYSSLWNADDWATRGGLVKTDWSQAPFTASYRNFNANVCVWSNGASSCKSDAPSSTNATWFTQELDSTSQQRLQWVRKNYMIYNYCTDAKRFPQGLPPECRMS